MALRRTPITRGTVGLVRRTPLRAGKRRTAMKTQPRPRDTGPSRAVREVVLARSGGCCELCGRLLWCYGTGWVADHSVHHRRPRAAGGSTRPDTNTPVNLLLLCGSATTTDGCHAHVEANRTEALAYGWLVLQAQDPAATVVHVRTAAGLTPVLLTAYGTYEGRGEL